ncbi:MAG: metallophosphoesterase family protein [Thermomicrobiales bacterium]|nr:metallophosphoesterase family protein [Thermomicrobiales bacterium]
MTNRKIAIISDIHGFSLALDRVLADIDAAQVDELIVAGDLVETGPDPAGVLDRLQSRECVVIQGNTDDAIANSRLDSKLATWTEKQIGKEGRQWLRDLPFSHRVRPVEARSPWDDLLVVHANPFDFLRAIEPEAGEHELDELIGGTEAAVLAFGHIHIAYIRELSRMTLLDVSAVGNPKDGDLRSKWGLATWDSDTLRWSVELRYVDYPLAETEAQMRASGMPNVEKHLAKLKRASYV